MIRRYPRWLARLLRPTRGKDSPGAFGVDNRAATPQAGNSAAAAACEVIGHDWQPCEPIYEHGRTLAYIGQATEKTEVPVTWVCDEICSQCGGGSWWPA